MKKQFLTIGVVFMFVLGCKLGSTTAHNAGLSEGPENRTLSVSPSNGAAPESTPKPAQTANAVCSDPAKPCHHSQKHFDDWELSFKMPAKLTPNKPHKSAPFYAVILKTYPMGDDCDGGEYIEKVEAERRREQANQLERKVFAAYQCPNMGAVDYEFAGKWDAKKENVLIGNFIAIYAGKTKAEGEEALDFYRNTYPQAQLKQMTASYELIEQ